MKNQLFTILIILQVGGLNGQFTLRQDQIERIYTFESTLFDYYTEGSTSKAKGRVNDYRYSNDYIQNSYKYDENIMAKLVKNEQGKIDKKTCNWVYFFGPNLPKCINNLRTKKAISKQISKAIEIVVANSCGSIFKTTPNQEEGYREIDMHQNPLDIFDKDLKIYFTSKQLTAEQREALNAPIRDDEALAHLMQANCWLGKQVRVFPRNGDGKSQNVLVIRIAPDLQQFDDSFFLRQIIHGIGHLLHEQKMQLIRSTEDNYWHGKAPVNQTNVLPKQYVAAISDQATKSVKEFIAEFYEYLLLATPNFSISNYKKENIEPYSSSFRFQGINASIIDLLEIAVKYRMPNPEWSNLEKVIQEFAFTTGSTMWTDQNKKVIANNDEALKAKYGILSPRWAVMGKPDLIDIDYNTVFKFTQIDRNQLTNNEIVASSLVGAIDNVLVVQDEIVSQLGYWRQFATKNTTENKFNNYGLSQRSLEIHKGTNLIKELNTNGPFIVTSMNGNEESALIVVGATHNRRKLTTIVKCFFPYEIRYKRESYSGHKEMVLSDFTKLLKSLNPDQDYETDTKETIVTLY